MITLEPFERTDFERLINWIDTEEILVQFGGPIFSFPLTIEQLEAYTNDKQRLSFKVVDQSSKTPIGHAELFPSDDNKTMKICRILIGDKQKRGQGLGQQIINELLKISFITLGKERAELNVYDWNTSAIKCYEKVGFTINPDKIFTSTVKENTWTAINMTIDKQHWIS
ncbi:GNAT family N-acetyltransferase [Ferruginibacter lapsinanis]|uniref:GNAT family N-acetyltransferase n=1 Tax=Ferruginibacter lapsinanis TaxID=563172 RepID=UPI001E28F5BD|nr:GNAT family protein [Ferruginibacter lapsinanis]UEG49706.1 GNAT family N-acetyltransferase [Ferruginibacter lapsinanis]